MSSTGQIVCLILAVFYAAAAAQEAQTQIDLDQSRMKNPSSFEVKVGSAAVMNFINTITTCGNAQDFQNGPDGTSASAQLLDQCEYYSVPNGQVPSVCSNDVDLCAAEGFTITATVKPERPNPDGGSTAWLLGLGGYGKDGDYGIKIGFQNAQVVVHIITSNNVNKIECKLPETVTEQESWYTLSVIRRKPELGEIKIFVNGTKLTTNCKNVVKTANNNPPTVKRNEITLGAAKEFDNVIGALYAGLVDQVCLFPRFLNKAALKKARKDGCFSIK